MKFYATNWERDLGSHRMGEVWVRRIILTGSNTIDYIDHAFVHTRKSQFYCCDSPCLNSSSNILSREFEGFQKSDLVSHEEAIAFLKAVVDYRLSENGIRIIDKKFLNLQ